MGTKYIKTRNFMNQTIIFHVFFSCPFNFVPATNYTFFLQKITFNSQTEHFQRQCTRDKIQVKYNTQIDHAII